MLRDPAILDFTLPAPDRAVLQRLAALLRQELGAALDRVVLFGSRARGDCDEDSDVDLLVLVRVPEAEEGAADDRVWELLGRARREAAPEASLNIKPIVMTSGRFAALRARELGFALDIEEEGIEL